MCCKANGQLSACGMPHHRYPRRIHSKSSCLLPHKPVRGANVIERAWPPAARISHAPVLDIERCDTCPAQRLAQVPGMSQVIFGVPIPAMNIDQPGMDTRRPRQPYLHKLLRVCPIGDPLIRRWLRLDENVFNGHR